MNDDRVSVTHQVDLTELCWDEWYDGQPTHISLDDAQLEDDERGDPVVEFEVSARTTDIKREMLPTFDTESEWQARQERWEELQSHYDSGNRGPGLSSSGFSTVATLVITLLVGMSAMLLVPGSLQVAAAVGVVITIAWAIVTGQQVIGRGF